jgi:hypothetical protein
VIKQVAIALAIFLGLVGLFMLGLFVFVAIGMSQWSGSK